ncbi:MAG: EF-P beta-lysylation protein EpmB [Pseudohongiellaceae bacterium]
MSSTATTIPLARTAPDGPGNWQQQLSDAITDPGELLDRLGLTPRSLGQSLDIPPSVLESFPLRVPRAFVARMQPGNPHDPLLLQVLPLGQEGDDTPGFVSDPLREADANSVPGLLHKYHGRALLLVAPHCAVHCRYCFRRHFPYEENTPGRREWDAALKYLADHEDITEVIYSGGDPLAAPDRLLAWLTARIAAIPHIRRLRIHTRTPVMMPDRVTDALLEWLADSGLATTLVVHCNHPAEIDREVAAAMARLRGAGVTLLNQSVLLRGINDDEETLAALSEKLFSAGILPYYIHMLDRVQGVAHFDVPETRARSLMQAVRNRLPGYLVPRLARELPGEGAKTILG